MKKILLLTTMFVALATISFGQNLATSAHDFTDGDTWFSTTESSGNELCGTCHVPHKALTANGPLWAHNSVNATAAYTPYGSTAAGVAGVTIGGTTVPTPSKYSMACLSCHDGATTLNSHLYGDADPTTITAANNVGVDLSGSHPVSVVYNTAKAGLKVTTSATGVVSHPTVEDWLKGTTGTSTVECGSCHNPHDDAVAKFLWVDNTASALCTTCHAK